MNHSRSVPSPSVFLYFAALSVTVTGWLHTISVPLVDPLYGVGYWLGIIGGVMMLVLLLYPVRKRITALSFLGKTRYWFKMHMALGVLGPIAILFHCNFRLGSLNSTMALVCTLVVAVSGLVGRYVYGRIYSDLSGHKILLGELVGESVEELATAGESVMLLPELHQRARQLHQDALDRLAQRTPSLVQSWLFGLRIAAEGRRMKKLVRAWLRENPELRWTERRRHRRVAFEFIEKNLAAVRRMYQLSAWERLFALWHVFHLPFFYMLVVTATIHVLAVHMY